MKVKQNMCIHPYEERQVRLPPPLHFELGVKIGLINCAPIVLQLFSIVLVPFPRILRGGLGRRQSPPPIVNFGFETTGLVFYSFVTALRIDLRTFYWLKPNHFRKKKVEEYSFIYLHSRSTAQIERFTRYHFSHEHAAPPGKKFIH